MIRLYAVSILPLKSEACYENCYRRSTASRREKADALRTQDDKARCIAAGLLLEYAYKKFRIEKTKELANANSFGYVKNTEDIKADVNEQFERLPEIRTGQRGKPEFVFPEGEMQKVYFNLSHSGNYVICAMADDEVGVDVQVRAGIRETLLRRFFSEEERKRVEECGEATGKERTFAQIWAVREAETKLTGRGIGQLLDGRGVNDGEMKVTGGKNAPFCIWQGMLDAEHAWAVAGYPKLSEGETAAPEPVFVDGGELFDERMF